MRTCGFCGGEYEDGRADKVYCSGDCRRGAKAAVLEEVNGPPWDVSPPTKGAIAELFVSADLLKKGYEVFRAQSAACSCDLVTWKDGAFLRVEVKCGVYGKRGGMQYQYPRDPTRYDLLAVVSREGEVTYLTPDRELI